MLKRDKYFGRKMAILFCVIMWIAIFTAIISGIFYLIFKWTVAKYLAEGALIDLGVQFLIIIAAFIYKRFKK